MKVITQRPSWKIATDPTSPLAGPRYGPAPAHGAIVGHVGSFPDLIPHIPADRTATGVRVKTARAAAKMPFRSAIRLAYSLHMRCRDRYRGPIRPRSGHLRTPSSATAAGSLH